MEGFRLQKYLFGGLFALLFLLLIVILSPFFYSILWSLRFFILINPLFVRLLLRYPERTRGFWVYKNVLAAVMSFLTVSLIVVPLFFIGKEAVRQSFQVAKLFEGFVRKYHHLIVFKPEDPIVLLFKDLSSNTLDLSTVDITKQLLSLLRESIDTIVRASTFVIKNIATFVINLCLIVFTLFFLLVDGHYLMGIFVRAIPIKTGHLKVFILKFKETVKHLATGYVLVALYQAPAACIIFFAFDVPGFLLLSLVLFFFAFIPMIGAAGIWIPIVLLKFLSGDIGASLVMTAFCWFFVSTVDNILRPMVLKDRIQIHPLLIFFSILGAVVFFGFHGIVLGPLIVIFFFAALEIFIDLYEIRSDEGKHGESEPRCDDPTGPGEA